MDLISLGWSAQFEEYLAEYAQQGCTAGRVALEHTHMYRIFTERGERLAEVSGKLRHQAQGREDFPAVGDWVAISEHDGGERAIIHAVMPRTSKFSRKTAGFTTEEQIVAANVDYVFLVNALNHDFNVRRLERYLLLTWESGANPVIVLSKADLCEDIERKLEEVESVAFGVPTHVTSSLQHDGMETLKPYLQQGKTIALLGSSGAGKSTIINELLGAEVQRVYSVREGDDRGRHTTTHREMFILPQGALLIDTPGMRELQLWHGEDGLRGTFADIEALVDQCYYSDCRHRNEPRCAIKAALTSGALDGARYENYNKMLRELAHLEAKEGQKRRQMEKERGKKHSQFHKQDKKKIY